MLLYFGCFEINSSESVFATKSEIENVWKETQEIACGPYFGGNLTSGPLSTITELPDPLDLARFGVFGGSDLEWIWPSSAEFGRSADLARFFVTFFSAIFSLKVKIDRHSILNGFGRLYHDLADL